MNNASVSSVVPETLADVLGQVREIDKAVLRGLSGFYLRLTSVQRQEFVSKPTLITDVVVKAVTELLPKRIILPHAEVERWNRYYFDEYGIDCSFEGLEVPVEAEFPTRLIVMHEAISGKPQRVADVYKKRCGGKWWQFAPDLDVAVPKHDRFGTYAIRVADVVEAPDGSLDGRNLSSREVWDRGWATTTLPERLVDGDMCLRERKIHLDRKVITLCSGSRSLGGDIPSVNLIRDGSVHVRCWGASRINGHLYFFRKILI
jgi:hypothetical protein